MRKLARIATGVFKARYSHVGAKRCYGSKISKDGFIKVMIGLTELIGEGCPWMSQRSERIYNGSKEFKTVPRVITRLILALTCLESDREPNTIVIEDTFLFPTVIYTP
jgi:hypothetical protein